MNTKNIFGRSNDRDNNYFFKSSRPIFDFRFLMSSTNLLTPGLDIKQNQMSWLNISKHPYREMLVFLHSQWYGVSTQK